MHHKIDTIKVILTVLIFCACAAAVIVLNIQTQKHDAEVAELQELVELNEQGTSYWWGKAWEAEQKVLELENREPEIITEYITKEVIKEVEIPIETIVYRNIYAREFESVSQFREWAEPKLAVLWLQGKEADCDDYAEHLQVEALKEGYPLSCVLVEHGLLLGRRVSPITELHMGNLLMTKTDIYYVEPQTGNFDVVWVCARD